MSAEADTNSTRSSLLERVSRSPDDPGWAEFDGLYRAFLIRICGQLGIPGEEAKDISQEVLADLVRKLPDFSYDREKGSFRGWLRQRVRWKVWDVSKRPSGRIFDRVAGGSEEIDTLANEQS